MMSKEVKNQNGCYRFKVVKVLANTLQGRIYLAQDRKGQYPWAVIKETWRELVRQGRSRDGHKVPENFENEKEIQLYLSTLSHQNDGYARCIENWENESCYYLAMEYCAAGELFDFVRNSHANSAMSELVRKATSAEQICQPMPSAWSMCVQLMFRQLVDTVSWMHSHGVAHLDLSLENTLISSVDANHVHVKIIDFGLARRFKPDQTFRGRVGKISYMAPEVYARTEYSPEKADIWCLGVMLFMMLVGAPPYQFPDPSNPAFRFIVNGRLRDVLTHWKRLPLVPADALDLMNRIFKPEGQRISMRGLRLHKFIGLPDKTATMTNGNPDALCLDSQSRQSGNVETLSDTDNTNINTNINVNVNLNVNINTKSSANANTNANITNVNTNSKTDSNGNSDSNGNTDSNSSGNNKRKGLMVKAENIPWMKTKQAQDMAQQLRHITQVDDMHTFIQNMQSIIDHLSNVSKNLTDHHLSHTMPLVDHDSCLHELQLLLLLAKDTLQRVDAA